MVVACSPTPDTCMQGRKVPGAAGRQDGASGLQAWGSHWPSLGCGIFAPLFSGPGSIPRIRRGGQPLLGLGAGASASPCLEIRQGVVLPWEAAGPRAQGGGVVWYGGSGTPPAPQLMPCTLSTRAFSSPPTLLCRKGNSKS